MKIKKEMYTKPYENVHGKKPKGEGHWTLELCVLCVCSGWFLVKHEGKGHISDVRREAMKKAKTEYRGIERVVVHVLP